MAPRADASAGIRKSPYAPGVYFVDQHEWHVGERYEIVRLLGSGSFSSVCLCLDTAAGEQVAIKRIPDVLASPEQGKRVLREVAILRRLRHPNVIALRDAFTRPSATGGHHFVGGQLVPASIDAYLVMEFADGGDLFNLRGQLSAAEVRGLMHQILDALRYLHTQSVWHRDLKSSNVLLTKEGGKRIAKIADLGSARSAVSEGYHWVEQPAPGSSWGRGTGVGLRTLSATAAHPDHMPHVDSADGVKLKDLCVQLGNKAGPGPCGLASPLTRMVATPCYRAPEVVMSRGGYTSSIDMWSAGCIFGELLQRVTYVGSAATPQLQVAPLFAIHGMPKTPDTGDTFVGGAGSDITRRELKALFDVIGTPSWADANAVAVDAWRHYLQGLPGKSPTLYRRLGAAGEPAVHLLSRLLHFEPMHRATALEALAHEFFAGEAAASGDRQSATPGRASLQGAASGAIADGIQAMELDESKQHHSPPRSPTGKNTKRARFALSALKPSSSQPDMQQPDAGDNGYRSGGSSPTKSAFVSGGGSPTKSAVASARSSLELAPPLNDATAEPADALHAIEAETGDVSAGSSKDALVRLRTLLEREIAAAQHAAKQLLQAAAATMAANELQRTTSAGRLELNGHAAAAAAAMHGGRSRERRYSFSEMRSWEGLQEDLGATTLGREAAEYGQGRLANVADTVDGKLDPAEYLKRGRHGEWTLVSGTGPRAGPSWGVSSLPPGMDLSDPRVMAAIQAQQRR